ncbi:hypothetical protein [Streptomyces sp. H34-S4]|uniref:hypothetical protein n=1 Tax=Streptomyces sp. H34-S4 TaxID=2996463 RepID=UPI00226F34CB|nr:hypothetical protein [Streptomyces sp. H34-S4]MCY0933872.1 hypothetical protein [Streptomyces sp. H34-S4]
MKTATYARIVSWSRRNVSEFRIGVALVLLGAPITAVGGILYAVSVPGFPEVVVGLAFLITGLVMTGAEADHRDRRTAELPPPRP